MHVIHNPFMSGGGKQMSGIQIILCQRLNLESSVAWSTGAYTWVGGSLSTFMLKELR